MENNWIGHGSIGLQHGIPVEVASALSRAAHDHMQRSGLDCPHDIGLVLIDALVSLWPITKDENSREDGYYWAKYIAHGAEARTKLVRVENQRVFEMVTNQDTFAISAWTFINDDPLEF